MERLLTRLAWRAAICAGALMLCSSGAAAQPMAAAATAVCPPEALTAEERRLMFQALRSGEDPTEAPEAAFDDATMTATLKRYATLVLGLRIRPSQADRLWAIESPRRDVAGELKTAREQGRLASWLKALEPPHAGYRRLAAERCRYRMIVDAGGWRPLPPGPTLKVGDPGAGVQDLRERLAVEGYGPDLLQPALVFDAALGDALRAFQRRHDLEEDGVLGPDTRRELDVSAEDRLIQIEANLERWRWLPHTLPTDRLELDTGAATATLYESDHPALEMRVIVGDPDHKTPMFTSRLEAVVFNPPWNVPDSIARKEILPKAARSPGYLARNGFQWTASGLQQRPGPTNALGQLKFDLRSPFGVYLHDTPGRASFGRRVRTLSHGCMRLEKPRELAEQLLASQGWTRARIDLAVAQGSTQRIALQTPLPLFVIYRTARVGPDGWATFSRDRYGWDHKLMIAIANSARAGSDQPQDSECSASDR
jgi:L,D-transpeptidase YcbB